MVDGPAGPCMDWCMAAWWWWVVCMGLVRLDLGVESGLDGEGEEVVGVVKCEM